MGDMRYSDATARTTLAWVGSEGGAGVMESVSVTDVLVALSTREKFWLMSCGLMGLDIRALKALMTGLPNRDGLSDRVADNMFPLDTEALADRVDEIKSEAQRLYEEQRKVGDGSWYNAAPSVRSMWMLAAMTVGEREAGSGGA